MSTDNNVKAFKSGIWYTVANFITRSIGFITTPIFTRLLSQNDFGLYSNYTSWLSTFTIFATLSLGASFISARFDYEDDFDGYVSSTLVLSSIVTVVWAIIINIFSHFFSVFTGIETMYLNIMIIYLFLFSAVDMFQIRERYNYEYKVSVQISLLIAISTALLSVVLVVFMDNKLFGRILGNALPIVFIGVILYVILIRNGRKVLVSYWKYALKICLPYIPHLLSLSLLNSMDKIMITKICGAEENSLYSVAYSCSTVITFFATSLNTAFSPWLGEKLNEKRYGEIRKISKPYILFFVYVACGIMLLTPELLLVMGGRDYYVAIYVMPPVTFGCVCQFMYTMYVNIEQYNRKTIGMAFASVIAAALNFVLNSIFVPLVGFLAAAYTTLACFFILLIIHMLLVKKMGLWCVFPNKYIFIVLGFLSGYTLFVHVLYINIYVRYGIIILYIITSLLLLRKYKYDLLKIIKNRQ